MTCTVACEKGFVLHSSGGKKLGSTQVSGPQDGPWDQDLDEKGLTTLRWLERAQTTLFLQPQPSCCFPNESQLGEAPVLDPCACGWCFCSGDPSLSLLQSYFSQSSFTCRLKAAAGNVPSQGDASQQRERWLFLLSRWALLGELNIPGMFSLLKLKLVAQEKMK